MADETNGPLSLEQRVAFLEDALAGTQDRLMAVETVLRVLAYCLHGRQALPADLLLAQLEIAARQLHEGYAEEFSEVVRALNLFADWVRSDMCERDG